jgi:hypothetical protein
MDRKRKKRLKKQEEGLLEQAQKHLIKTETEIGRKDTTKDYWLGEAERFKKQAEVRAEMLEKLQKKKSKEDGDRRNKS